MTTADPSAPGPKRRRVWRRLGIVAGIMLLLLFLTGLVALVSSWQNLGQLPSDRDLARLRRSPEWRGDRFVNRQPLWTDGRRIWSRMLLGPSVPDVVPDAPVPVLRDDRAHFASPPPSGLRITWFGHSSTLVEVDGVRILTDPLWSERASPLAWAGPKRWYLPPVALRDLPPIDAVLISHDHYDHLDRATMVALKATAAKFIVPLGIGSHLEYWGISRSRIVELDWWQSARIAGVEVVATPARHYSGRISMQSDQTLWAGFAMIGAHHRVWYSGDTGFHAGFADIGRRYGPFDATLIEAGQYDPLWPDTHLGPERAVEVNRLVGGKVMIPVHWGLLSLAPHGWTEPLERVVVAVSCTKTAVMVPRPGESVEPTRPIAIRRWWPSRQWLAATRKPIVATADGDPAHRHPQVDLGQGSICF